MIYYFTLIEATSLVVGKMGFQTYISCSILTRIKFFSSGSVTFSMFLRVFYLYACLIATVLQIYTLFISANAGEQGGRRGSRNVKVSI